METRTSADKNLVLIGIVSVVVPLLVAFLIFNPTKIDIDGGWVYFLPHLNAVINSATAILLLAGLYFIKQGNESYHKAAMISAFALGGIFLVSYILYHSSVGSVKFGDIDGDGLLSAIEVAEIGGLRTFYLGLLFTHIVFAGIVVPLVLLAIYYAWNDNRAKHRKFVKFAWPIWLFVSVSGVVVYLMISPYYLY